MIRVAYPQKKGPPALFWGEPSNIHVTLYHQLEIRPKKQGEKLAGNNQGANRKTAISPSKNTNGSGYISR